MINGTFRRVLLVYAVVALLLWPLPVLGLLHAESSAVLAFTAYFTAGLSSLGLFRRGGSVGGVILQQELALLLPAVLLSVTMLWRPNCAYAEGLKFFALFPTFSVLLAVSIAYLIDALGVPLRKTTFVVSGVALVITGLIYDLGFHPQFYTYNHVFGGVMGPIYDEELAVRGGLYYFRGLTLLWSALVFLTATWVHFKRRPGSVPRSSRVAAVGAVILIAIGTLYLGAAPVGINAKYGYIRQFLDAHTATEHFDIFYESGALSTSELTALADEHEFRYRQIAEELDIEVSGRIQIYIYPDVETRANLIGARYTNVAPVWLGTPQMHVLLSDFERVFTHELVHVFSREFGLPVVNASLSIGLVEGLAGALEPPRGTPSAHQQVSAALFGGFASGRSTQDLARSVASRMSALGFWTGRGAVSYTTMGSFVAYLLETYGPDLLKKVYSRADFENVYGKSIDVLAEEWTIMLRSIPYAEASSGRLMAARFAVPSLFEKDCPHYTPPHRRSYLDATTALARRDTVLAVELAEHALQFEPSYIPALDLWSRLALINARQSDVLVRLRRIPPDSMTAGLLVRLGDALALEGDSVEGRVAYRAAFRRLPSYAHEDRSRLTLRMLGASHPSTIRMLVRGIPGSEDEQETTTIWARALAHARLGRFELAAYLLRTTPMSPDFHQDDLLTPDFASVDLDALRRRGLVWLAKFTYRAGSPSTAASFAAEAVDRYRSIGAFNEAEAIDDFRGKMLWLVSREPTREGLSSNM